MKNIIYFVIICLIPHFLISNETQIGIEFPQTINPLNSDILIKSNKDFISYKTYAKPKIDHLNVFNSNIDSLLGMCRNVKMIESIQLVNCYGSKYVQVFNEIEASKKVRNIIIDNINMEDFADFFSQFDSLERIEINNCNLTSLKFLESFKTTLKYLRLYNITLDSIGNYLNELVGLKELFLCNINENSDGNPSMDFSNFTLLESLYIETDIKKINLINCCNLKSLSLFTNYFSPMKEFLSIDKCCYLKWFDIGCKSSKYLSLIRDYLDKNNLNYDSLEVIGLIGLGYREIPRFILKCKNLERLELRNNKIRNIDFVWNDFDKLTNLDFRNNLIDSIPKSLKQCISRISSLSLEGNNIDNEEMEKYDTNSQSE